MCESAFFSLSSPHWSQKWSRPSCPVSTCTKFSYQGWGVDQLKLTDHHPARLLAEVAPVAVDEGLLEFRCRDLTGFVLVHCVEPLCHTGVHLGTGRGAAGVASGRCTSGVAAGRRTAWGWCAGTAVALQWERNFDMCVGSRVSFNLLSPSCDWLVIL